MIDLSSPVPSPEPHPDDETGEEEPEPSTHPHGDDDDDEREPTPVEDAAQADEDEMRAQAKVLGDEAERHFDTVQEILGEGIEIYPCATCEGNGFTPMLTPQSPIHERCEICGGFGIVRTGSFVQSRATISCDKCQGNGFIRKGPQNVDGPPEPGAPVVQFLSPDELPIPQEPQPIALPDGVPA